LDVSSYPRWVGQRVDSLKVSSPGSRMGDGVTFDFPPHTPPSKLNAYNPPNPLMSPLFLLTYGPVITRLPGGVFFPALPLDVSRDLPVNSYPPPLTFAFLFRFSIFIPFFSPALLPAGSPASFAFSFHFSPVASTSILIRAPPLFFLMPPFSFNMQR